MRVKRIRIYPAGNDKWLVAEGLGERGATPVIGKVLVVGGDVKAALADAATQATLHLRPDRAPGI